MAKEGFTRHPIQIAQLDVYRLSADMRDVDERVSADEENEALTADEFKMVVSSVPYEKGSKAKYVRVRVDTFGKRPDRAGHPGYEIVAEIGAVFEVDESRFPIDYIDDWGEKNAPLIIYPYIREAVTSLNFRCGVADVVLPLFEVPTYRIMSERSESSSKKPNSSDKVD